MLWAGTFGEITVTESAAVARDTGSLWLLSPRPIRIGGLLIARRKRPLHPNALRFTDSSRFGSGHRSTTALCIVESDKPDLPVLWTASPAMLPSHTRFHERKVVHSVQCRRMAVSDGIP